MLTHNRCSPFLALDLVSLSFNSFLVSMPFIAIKTIPQPRSTPPSRPALRRQLLKETVATGISAVALSRT